MFGALHSVELHSMTLRSTDCRCSRNLHRLGKAMRGILVYWSDLALLAGIGWSGVDRLLGLELCGPLSRISWSGVDRCLEYAGALVLVYWHWTTWSAGRGKPSLKISQIRKLFKSDKRIRKSAIWPGLHLHTNLSELFNFLI